LKQYQIQLQSSTEVSQQRLLAFKIWICYLLNYCALLPGVKSTHPYAASHLIYENMNSWLHHMTLQWKLSECIFIREVKDPAERV
jgi:hypothetical protein